MSARILCGDGLSPIEFDHLLEIAYLAVDEGLCDPAWQIFDVLRRLGGSNPHPRIGLALVDHARHDSNSAIERLEDILREHPRAVFCRSLLARMLRESGRGGWRVLAEEAIALAPVGIAADIARDLLGSEGASPEVRDRSAAQDTAEPAITSAEYPRYA